MDNSDNQIVTPGLAYLHREWRDITSDLILVVTEPHTWQPYRSKLGLDEHIPGKTVQVFEAPRGEASKTAQVYFSALDFFLKKKIHRRACLVAVGGGATLDLAGFVAATLLRGLEWWVVPTTLLSMVDASIGGKVGINWNGAKNQVGAFHSPRKIFLCAEFLSTLGDDEWSSGVGEMVKTSFLDGGVSQLLEERRPLGEILLACAQYKQAVVAKGQREGRARRVLNLGHTFGHALEQIYQLPHGEAVYWGMGLIFQLYGGQALLPKLKARAMQLWASPRWRAPAPWCGRGFPATEILNLIDKDKKAISSEAIELVLMQEIGRPMLEVVSFADLAQRLEQNRELLENFTL